MTDIGVSFGKPFPEQLAAFRLRLGNLAPSVKWDDLDGAAHARAFMVAGAQKAELLDELARAVDKVIAAGTTLDAFTKDFLAIAERNGWRGWTGDETDKRRAWRARVIYNTNVATSRSAGRMAQLVDGKYPFWVYKHGGSREPRLQHLSWDGIALPPDHPFWATHAPPNGWGCSCRIFGARTAAGIRRVGGDPNKVLPDGWQAIDPKTGVQVGIDKGWDYKVGATVSQDVLSLRPVLDRLSERPSVDLIQSWLTEELFGKWLAAPHGSFPLVRISAADAERIGSKGTVADLSAESAIKQMREHPELSILDYAQAQKVVTDATQIIKDGPTSLIYVQEVSGANGHVLVVKATVSGKGLFVTSFRRLSGDPGKRARALDQLLRKMTD